MEAKYEQEVLQWQKLQKEFTTSVTNRQQLEAQLKENEMVLGEMNLLDKDANQVYKLIGPVLVKQDLAESRLNVEKRIEFIQKESKRLDQQIDEFQKKIETQRAELMKIQLALQQRQPPAATRSTVTERT